MRLPHLRFQYLLCAGLLCSGTAFAQFSVTLYSAGLSANSAPGFIAQGPDGALWFTELLGNRIGRITTAGTITEFSAGMSVGAGPIGITTGPDGALWFTEFGGNRIGRITTAGTITEFS